MARLNISPEVCVALEDTETGVRAASEAGLPVLAIPHALSAHQDLSRATRRFDDLAQAANWLLRPVRPAL